MKAKKIKVKVSRYNPAKDSFPRFKTYEVPVTTGMSIYNVLQYINENYDGGLSHYCSCRLGVCKGCMVRVNGKPMLACSELAEKDMTLEPVNKKKVIKDLLVDF
jgi:succinate dehydrogenase/fumarate reductase iron-sulfur protein